MKSVAIVAMNKVEIQSCAKFWQGQVDLAMGSLPQTKEVMALKSIERAIHTWGEIIAVQLAEFNENVSKNTGGDSKVCDGRETADSEPSEMQVIRLRYECPRCFSQYNYPSPPIAGLIFIPAHRCEHCGSAMPCVAVELNPIQVSRLLGQEEV
jgi:hypothetical protein